MKKKKEKEKEKKERKKKKNYTSLASYESRRLLISYCVGIKKYNNKSTSLDWLINQYKIESTIEKSHLQKKKIYIF